jgi:hypothetical protein
MSTIEAQTEAFPLPNAETPDAESVETPHTDPVDTPDAGPVDTLGQTPHEPKTRPWEQELLISGATVFALLQLPAQVDAWSRSVLPRLDGAWAGAALLVWLYVKLALYALIFAFTAHLFIRAYWVAVIGLEAVFPRGIRWDGSRAGPIMSEIRRRRTPQLQSLIDRADRLASVVFASGITAALFCLFGLMVAGVAAVVSVGAARLLGRDARIGAASFDLLLLAILGPVFAGALVDRYYGDRLDPKGFPARAIRRLGEITTGAWRVMPFIPLILTMTTNATTRPRGRHLIRVMIVAAMVGAIALMLRARMAPDEGLVDGYRFFPAGVGAQGLDTRFYEDARSDEQVDGKTPSIQSDMVRDPYVRLFIPYRPIRHNELMEKLCGLSPDRPDEPRVIACMLRLQPVSMDGRPVTVPFRLYTQPKSELRGIVGYLPVDGLTKGEHVITVGALPPAPPKPGETPDRRGPAFNIRFWL